MQIFQAAYFRLILFLNSIINKNGSYYFSMYILTVLLLPSVAVKLFTHLLWSKRIPLPQPNSIPLTCGVPPRGHSGCPSMWPGAPTNKTELMFSGWTENPKMRYLQWKRVEALFPQREWEKALSSYTCEK